MVVYAGIDEAGYGPLLGPLVVSMSAFEREGGLDDAPPPDLWETLGDELVLRAPPKGRGAKRDRRLVVCDSKRLHRSGRGLGRMEETVLSFALAGRGAGPDAEGAKVGEVGESPLPTLATLGGGLQAREDYPWYAAQSLELPRYTFATVVRRRGAELARHLASRGLCTVALRAVPAHPREFNGGVRTCGNKHLFEWSIVGAILRRLLRDHGEEGVHVTVDRLSGRTRYGPLLAKLFPRSRVSARWVGDPEGAAWPKDAASPGDPAPAEPGATLYEVRKGARRLQVRFLTKGDDRSFEVALASLLAKYMRELLMVPLNAYFSDRVPGLKPTAGYVQDGRRFLRDIAPALRELDLDRNLLIRCA